MPCQEGQFLEKPRAGKNGQKGRRRSEEQEVQPRESPKQWGAGCTGLGVKDPEVYQEVWLNEAAGVPSARGMPEVKTLKGGVGFPVPVPGRQGGPCGLS